MSTTFEKIKESLYDIEIGELSKLRAQVKNLLKTQKSLLKQNQTKQNIIENQNSTIKGLSDELFRQAENNLILKNRLEYYKN